MLSKETPLRRGFLFLETASDDACRERAFPLGRNMTPAQFTEWREACGGRRFLMTMGANGVNTLLFACGRLSEQGYLTTFAATVGAYLLARHMQERVDKP